MKDAKVKFDSVNIELENFRKKAAAWLMEVTRINGVITRNFPESEACAVTAVKKA